MEKWYVVIHKKNAFQWLTEKLSSVGIEFFAPTHVVLRNRVDRPSYREVKKQLFSGYLFVRSDEPGYHTIAAIPGVQGFVRFGDTLAWVQCELVDAMKKALLLRTNRTLSRIEYRNLPSDLMRALHHIIEMRSESHRKAALYALLEREAMSERLTGRSEVRICSDIHAD